MPLTFVVPRWLDSQLIRSPLGSPLLNVLLKVYASPLGPVEHQVHSHALLS